MVAFRLTTTEAAGMAGVAPSTIKRWADQGFLKFTRTAGGHRRFERHVVERLLREQLVSGAEGDPVATSWTHCLVHGPRHEIDGRLLEARGRLGTWYRVADELGVALVEMGTQWESGRLTISEEHVASDALVRALARVGDMLPTRLAGPKCLLACAEGDEHTLGLSLAELCLRELGWTPLWLGRRTPAAEVCRLVDGSPVSMVALSASAMLGNEQVLRAIADEVGAACEARGVDLLLGGQGAWPVRPSYGARLTSFAEAHGYLAAREQRRAVDG